MARSERKEKGNVSINRDGSILNLHVICFRCQSFRIYRFLRIWQSWNLNSHNFGQASCLGTQVCLCWKLVPFSLCLFSNFCLSLNKILSFPYYSVSTDILLNDSKVFWCYKSHEKFLAFPFTFFKRSYMINIFSNISVFTFRSLDYPRFYASSIFSTIPIFEVQ